MIFEFSSSWWSKLLRRKFTWKISAPAEALLMQQGQNFAWRYYKKYTLFSIILNFSALAESLLPPKEHAQKHLCFWYLVNSLVSWRSLYKYFFVIRIFFFNRRFLHLVLSIFNHCCSVLQLSNLIMLGFPHKNCLCLYFLSIEIIFSGTIATFHLAFSSLQVRIKLLTWMTKNIILIARWNNNNNNNNKYNNPLIRWPKDRGIYLQACFKI